LVRRAQVLRNQPRTNLLLRLLIAGRRGHAHERIWAEKVQRPLVALDGIPTSSAGWWRFEVAARSD